MKLHNFEKKRQRKCKVCGDVLEDPKSKSLYCPKCKMIECKFCGKGFPRKGSAKCCPECKKDGVKTTCSYCLREFVSPVKNGQLAKTCSKKHAELSFTKPIPSAEIKQDFGTPSKNRNERRWYE